MDHDPSLPPALAARFQDATLCGEGAFGQVWRARRADGGWVALKVLRPEAAARSAVLVRFQREARLATGIRSPRVARGLEAGEVEGVHFLAMQWVPGAALDGHLRARGGPLAPTEALDLLDQVLEGLAALHAEGVIHRDLKPANVMLDAEGRAVLVDLGLARDDGQDLTRTGAVMGSAAYMAPQQMQGESPTPDWDVYAAALMAIELATGRLPFDARDFPGILEWKRGGLRAGLRAEGVDWPAAVDRLLRQMLSPEPAERPADGAAARAQLQAARAHAEAAAGTVGRKAVDEAAAARDRARRAGDGEAVAPPAAGEAAGTVGRRAAGQAAGTVGRQAVDPPAGTVGRQAVGQAAGTVGRQAVGEPARLQARPVEGAAAATGRQPAIRDDPATPRWTAPLAVAGLLAGVAAFALLGPRGAAQPAPVEAPREDPAPALAEARDQAVQHLDAALDAATSSEMVAEALALETPDRKPATLAVWDIGGEEFFRLLQEAGVAGDLATLVDAPATLASARTLARLARLDLLLSRLENPTTPDQQRLQRAARARRDAALAPGGEDVFAEALRTVRVLARHPALEGAPLHDDDADHGVRLAGLERGGRRWHTVKRYQDDYLRDAEGNPQRRDDGRFRRQHRLSIVSPQGRPNHLPGFASLVENRGLDSVEFPLRPPPQDGDLVLALGAYSWVEATVAVLTLEGRHGDTLELAFSFPQRPPEEDGDRPRRGLLVAISPHALPPDPVRARLRAVGLQVVGQHDVTVSVEEVFQLAAGPLPGELGDLPWRRGQPGDPVEP